MKEGPTLRKKDDKISISALSIVVSEGQDTGKELAATSDRLSVGSAQDNDLVLSDPTVSRYHVEIRLAHGQATVRDLGSTNGTRVGSVLLRNSSATLVEAAPIRIGESSLQVVDGGELEISAPVPPSLTSLVARSAQMRRLISDVAKLAASDVPVLILGESGVGKELFAESLHRLGDRKEAPFVTVQCGAISPQLFASELFGHCKGAFTGATRDHIGAFERATGGTLFLDEVGELPIAQQVALLGALERGQIRRVGDSVERAVDIRLVCATNRDLRAEVNVGTFRLDLYYRIAVVLLQVPALRERVEDIGPLIAHLLEREGRSDGVGAIFSAEDLMAFSQHRWPGNVRELRNVVRAALALGQRPELVDFTTDDDSELDPFTKLHTQPFHQAKKSVVEQFEHGYLKSLLERSGNSLKQGAELAGLNRSHLSELLKRHGLR